MKKSFDDIMGMLNELNAQEVAYKSEVDLLKHHFSRCFEAGSDEARSVTYLAQPYEDRSAADGELYNELPYEARHWYGKKFSKFLESCPDSEFKDAVVAHRDRWQPLFQQLQDLIARQVKGRKPTPKKEPENTRTQFRAICPCCFREQAVKGDLMVAHGYTLEYGFQNGNCAGVNNAHFGTRAGLEFTKAQAAVARRKAEHHRNTAQKIRSGELVPTITDRKGEKVENPTPRQIEAQAYDYEARARGMDHYADFAEGMIAGWVEKGPISVQVPA